MIEKDEVHLNENKSHLQNWSDDGKQIFAVGSLVHAQLEEHPDLDSGVNHAADPEYWKKKRKKLNVIFTL